MEAAKYVSLLSKLVAFDGDCGITATAELHRSINGYPELTISINNVTDQSIAAIQFYALPCNGYGQEMTSWASQNRLYLDQTIAAGESVCISYQFIEASIKTIKLYVYSVDYADKTHWGDKTANKETIVSHGTQILLSAEA